uniref:uncharacterized protein LOC122591677 n=1 Tax=Erigeron canadensis TaxID=72917 RepID=UPI001CB9CB1E|nr:uncharacterized protein LOC122591677 [Erigeron canadensis]
MANDGFSFVEDLSVASDFWNMKARIIRKWEQTFKVDMVLLDERGNKIQAQCKNMLLSDFGQYLKEDSTIVIRRFGVAKQRDKYHVMGRNASCGDLDIFKNKEKESKRMNFELQDLSGQIIKCTLWGKYAEQWNKFICNNKSTEMVIAILQHAKLKRFNRELTVQNDMYGTRLFLNEDIQEANDLRRGLILRDGVGAASQTILESQTVYPFHKEFVVNTVKKMWMRLGNVMRMIEEDVGWFYVACRQHSKKVLTKDEFLEQAIEIPNHFLEAPIDGLWCLACNDIAISFVPKVQDHTGSVSLVMFDKDVAKLIGLSANDIRERQIRSGEVDTFPHELNVLLNKLYAFKISVAKYNFEKDYLVYTVAKVCRDPEIIEELQKKDEDDEGSRGEGAMIIAKLGESSQSKLGDSCQSRFGDSSQGVVESAEVVVDSSHFMVKSKTLCDVCEVCPLSPNVWIPTQKIYTTFQKSPAILCTPSSSVIRTPIATRHGSRSTNIPDCTPPSSSIPSSCVLKESICTTDRSRSTSIPDFTSPLCSMPASALFNGSTTTKSASRMVGTGTHDPQPTPTLSCVVNDSSNQTLSNSIPDTPPIGLRDAPRLGVSNSIETLNYLRKGKQKVTIGNQENSFPFTRPGLVFNKPTRKSNSRRKSSNLKMNDIPAFNLEIFNDPSTEELRKMKGVSSEYIDHGDQIHVCANCHAMMWEAEMLRGNKNGKKRSFSLCCKNGQVQLPDAIEPPPLLRNLFKGSHTRSTNFMNNIRAYNTMFSFTSMGGKVDKSVQSGRGPYCFRLQGQICHRMGSLLPSAGEQPKFSQLYIHDSENEVQHRLNALSGTGVKRDDLDPGIINLLKNMLDSCNPLVKSFRMVRDCLEENDLQDVILKLISTREKDGRTYNLPTVSEVAALIVGDIDGLVDQRDIVVRTWSGFLQRIRELHPSYLALQYPLLFPFAKDGFRLGIKHRGIPDDCNKLKTNLTLREFFCYRIQDRIKPFSLITYAKKLFHQLLVDAYTMVEADRLSYVNLQQPKLRTDTFINLRQNMENGNNNGSKIVYWWSQVYDAKVFGRHGYMQDCRISESFHNNDLQSQLARDP